MGARGEELARIFLVNKGYKILAADLKVGRSQVDLVARERGVPIVIEVKSRRGDVRPEAGLSYPQARRLINAGRAYFRKEARHVRLDLVTVRFRHGDQPEIHLFKGLKPIE